MFNQKTENYVKNAEELSDDEEEQKFTVVS